MTTDVISRSRLGGEPTPFGWEVQLRRLLEGYDAIGMIRLGGIQEFIDVMLANSPDRPLSETCFHEALRNVVQGWQPESSASTGYQERILRLIAAYTPNNGAGKIVGYLRKWGTFPGRIEAETEYGDRLDLTMLALMALEGYFAVPPERSEHDAGLFVAYTEMLRDYAVQAAYAGYALRRLLELDLIRPEALEIGGTPGSFGSTVSELILFFIDREELPTTQAHLSALYQQCLRIGTDATAAFGRAVTSTGAVFVPGTRHPTILTPHAKSIDLTVPPGMAKLYFLSTMQQQPDVLSVLENLDPYDEDVESSELEALLV